MTDANDATNWTITYASADMVNNPVEDYEVSFGYALTADNPYSSINGVIPPPPNGATKALRVTCNKNLSGGSAGVNVYLKNRNFSGDYAVRFNLNLIQTGAGGAVEGVLFGINHDGTQTNWWLGDTLWSGGPTWASDGVWYWIDATAGGATAGDYMQFTGVGGALPNTGWTRRVKTYVAFADVFKNPAPFSTDYRNRSGIPANGSPLVGYDASAWSDVEIRQLKNVVTLSIDKVPVFVFTNTITFTAGALMLGYNDPFASVGSPDGAAYFSNLRVVRLGPPVITGISVNGGSVQVEFMSADSADTVTSFVLQSSSGLTEVPADLSPAAAITQDPSSGRFHAVAPQNGAVQFYRIRHL